MSAASFVASPRASSPSQPLDRARLPTTPLSSSNGCLKGSSSTRPTYKPPYSTNSAFSLPSSTIRSCIGTLSFTPSTSLQTSTIAFIRR